MQVMCSTNRPWDQTQWVKIYDNKREFSPCMHDNCSECHGTGQKDNGRGMCIHMISCPCPKCTPHYF